MSERAPALTVKALRQRAIQLLARRDYSRQELVRKLAPLAPAELIDTVLNELQQQGLQSDARFAESWMNSHARRFGAARLRQDLRNKGIAAERVDAGLAAAGLGDEVSRAREVWARKFAAAPADAREWARQARFLQSRGFATDIIRRVLKSAGASEDEPWPA